MGAGRTARPAASRGPPRRIRAAPLTAVHYPPWLMHGRSAVRTGKVLQHLQGDGVAVQIAIAAPGLPGISVAPGHGPVVRSLAYTLYGDQRTVYRTSRQGPIHD